MLHLEGSLQNGSGGGRFTFAPTPSFPAEMRSLGVGDIIDRTIFVPAVSDLGTPTSVRELNALGVRIRSANQLIGMAALHLTSGYVHEFAALGLTSLSAESLISMRPLGVSSDFVKEIEALGFRHPSVNQLISMRGQGVTPEYIRKASATGAQNLAIDQIVGLRVQGGVE